MKISDEGDKGDASDFLRELLLSLGKLKSLPGVTH